MSQRGEILGFWSGVADVWRGGAFLAKRPGLWIWAAIPLALNVILFGTLAWLGWHYFGGWIDRMFFDAGGRWWARALGWLLRILFFFVQAFVTVVCFVPLAQLVASPFNDVLSDKTERIYAGSGVDERFSMKRLSATMWVSVKGSLWLALTTYGWMALALPLYLLPPPAGGILGSGVQTFIAIRYLALQYTAYSMDRRLYSHRQRDEFLKTNRGRTLGLGTMSFLIMTVPLVNALFIPISAVAGTMLFCDVERSGKKIGSGK